MSRKEFIATIGLGLASIMGFSTVIHLFTGKTFSSHVSQQSSLGYGASPYGGDKE